MSSIFVLDFGGQYSHLIANRIRRCGAYSEIVHNTISAEELIKKNPAGIILSGGPHSVFDPTAPKIDAKILELGIPILGICYGHQLIVQTLGTGTVKNADTQEFGKAELQILCPSNITKNITHNAVMWMNHGDEVTHVPDDFEILGSTSDCPVALMGDTKKNIYGAQFHPEVSHSEYGMQLLQNFVVICKTDNTWTIENFVETQIIKIQKQCEGKKVFLLVSGGVDSSVCFALITKALGKDRVFGCLVDHGMMRKNEADEVKKMLASAGFDDLHVEYASEKFLGNLTEKYKPEDKRVSIGNDFLELQAEISERMNLNPNEWLLGQGTIYPDTIESGGTEHASKIKTHHNRVERITKMIAEGKIIEPISDLYKDEVRDVGRELGLPEELVSRHPFPGPGLGVRVLCAQQPDILDKFEDREKKLNIQYPEYTAKILPIRSVGVQGDSRSYRHPVVLYRNTIKNINWESVGNIATEISNTDPEINRVLICVNSEKNIPENFSVQQTQMTPKRISVLQEVDAIVREEIFSKSCSHIWQFPVVLVPVFVGNKESIILRPIESENAMTATFAQLPKKILEKIITRIEDEIPQISQIFYDLTGKPPGTIEWE